MKGENLVHQEPLDETAAWKRAMYSAAKRLLGTGYIPDYYRSAASEFIQIAEFEIASQVKNAIARERRRRR